MIKPFQRYHKLFGIGAVMIMTHNMIGFINNLDARKLTDEDIMECLKIIR